VAELTGNLATNQELTNSNIGYIGIGCNPKGTQGTSLFTGYTSTPYPSSNPIISNPQCVADTQVIIASASNGGSPATTKYVATFAAGSVLGLTVYGAGTQPNTTLYPNLSLTVTYYPIYQ
jgi:hypothetical protein